MYESYRHALKIAFTACIVLAAIAGALTGIVLVKIAGG